MIHARRVAHRRVFTGLVVLVPLLFAGSLALRPEVPPRQAEARALREASGFAPAAGTARTIDAGDLAFELAREDARTIALRPRSVVLRPDLLVYWAPSGAQTPGEGAHLLGSLAGTSWRRLALPDAARAGGDVLVYSLPHAEVVARFPLAEGS